MDNNKNNDNVELVIKSLIDTIHQCLIAAGGSEDIDELEAQVKSVGTKPSDFIKYQFTNLQNRINDETINGSS